MQHSNQTGWDCLYEPIRELSDIRDEMVSVVDRFGGQIAALPPSHRDGARNLLHYLVLRRRDIRLLQEKLASVGLSSLGRCESHVLANIDALLSVSAHLTGQNLGAILENNFAFGKSDLDRETAAALGPKPANRDVRIMVTMPSEAATDYALVKALVSSGMDCMRINCAHDDPDDWAMMVEHLRRAQKEQGKSCRVVMDVAGPSCVPVRLHRLPG